MQICKGQGFVFMEQLDAILDEISFQLNTILQENMVGAYLHGSASYGTFTWEHSDIDMIVVVKSPLSVKTKLDCLASIHQLQPLLPEKGIEISFVLDKYCKHFVYPTPYELHFSNAVLPAYLQDPLSLCMGDSQTDTDLAAHFHVLTVQGIVICGDAIEHVFTPISKPHLLNSLLEDVHTATKTVLQDFPSTILSLCRVSAYVHEEKLLSKQAAISWATSHFETDFHAVIHHALEQYKSNKTQVSGTFQMQPVLQFCETALAQIYEHIPAYV